MARRRKSKQSNDIVKYSVIGVAVLATLMLIINFAPTGQFYNLQTYNAYGYNAFTEPPEDFALDTFYKISAMQPKASDHDGDGVSDQKECPDLFSDSDADGIEDIVETIQTGTDPNNADTDGDGYLDGVDSHPLDPTLPIPPTVGPVNPGPGPGELPPGSGDGELTPGSGDGELTPGSGDPGSNPVLGGGGFRTQTNNLLTGAFITGSAVHEGGLGGGLGGGIVITPGPTSDFTYDPVAPTVGETITFDGSTSNTKLMQEVCSNPRYGDKSMCIAMGACSNPIYSGGPSLTTEVPEEMCDEIGEPFEWVGYTWGKPTIIEYSWEFDDSSQIGASATQTYNTEGDFDVTLTVKSYNGFIGVSTQTLTVVTPTAVMQPPTGIGATVTDPAAEGLIVLDWITDKKLTGRFRNCPDNPKDITKGNGIPDIIDRGSDYDGDGWTDWYETQIQKSNPLEPSDEPEESKPGDSDGDGFNDKEETDASSDRSDPNSIPAGQSKGETSLIVSYDSTTQVCELLIRAGETRNALAILKITDAGTVTGFVYQTRVLENLKAQTLTMSKPSNGNLCEGFLWKDWSGTSLTDKVEIAI